jgi:SAM-dependent methyltransferase
VVGVDSSPDMLSFAGKKVPEGEFKLGELDNLPLPDASVDLVVCALALTHLPDLTPVLAEFARVVRPGGHVVLTDLHHELVFRGSVAKAFGPNGEPGVVANHLHTVGDFVRAALGAGLQVRRCEEPGRVTADERDEAGDVPAEIAVEGPDTWPWSLLEIAPSAAQAAWGIPAVVVFDFERA